MLAFGAPPFHSAEESDGFFNFLKSRPSSLDFFKYHPHTRDLYRAGKIPVSFMEILLCMLCADPASRLQDVSSLLYSDFFQCADVESQMIAGTQALVEYTRAFNQL